MTKSNGCAGVTRMGNLMKKCISQHTELPVDTSMHLKLPIFLPLEHTSNVIEIYFSDHFIKGIFSRRVSLHFFFHYKHFIVLLFETSHWKFTNTIYLLFMLKDWRTSLQRPMAHLLHILTLTANACEEL